MQVPGKKEIIRVYKCILEYTGVRIQMYICGVNRLRRSAENVWMLLTD